ncbi:four helix bundle protein [Flavobacterium lacus]|uniref:Four helix bundle protein n=1 Tax=Flavobacterium lacus TaxID=1353778 RepID=A0A328WNA6_9FLAO|nr:four helix bundle protein [Flavobacterium lacus]RAR46775.1 four helix bundle protein [Flavobacterium lacus]
MATINTFKELDIWQLSREICQGVWNAFENTSLGKDFELKNQMNRSSGSIMDNIAEGFERNGRRQFINFLSYSKGSCGELRSQLYRAFDRKHITEEEFEFLREKTITESKKIGSFMAYLVKSDNNGSKFDKK